MLVPLTSCAGSFVELVSKPRPKSEEPLKVVTWEGMVPQPLPSSAIENLDTANDTTAIVQSVDCQIYKTTSTPPFMISFFKDSCLMRHGFGNVSRGTATALFLLLMMQIGDDP